MKNLAVGWQRNSPGFIDREADFFAGNFAGAIAKTDSAVGIKTSNVRTGNAEDGALDGRSDGIFRLLDGFLDGVNSLFEIYQNALARTAGINDAVAAVAQAVVRNFGHEGTGLGAAYIDGRQ